MLLLPLLLAARKCLPIILLFESSIGVLSQLSFFGWLRSVLRHGGLGLHADVFDLIKIKCQINCPMSNQTNLFDSLLIMDIQLGAFLPCFVGWHRSRWRHCNIGVACLLVEHQVGGSSYVLCRVASRKPTKLGRIS